MLVLDRYNAVQNEHVRLYHIFEYNGRLADPTVTPGVTVVDKDKHTVLATSQATQESTGVWYYDYFVPVDADSGRYYDKWTYQLIGDTTDTEDLTYFEIHPKDTVINFTDSVISSRWSSQMYQAVRDLSSYFIYEAQHIPIYSEEAMRTADLDQFSFAFKSWNKDPRPLVRVNNRIVNKGWYADWDGSIFFETPLTETDRVTAQYNFAYFSEEELANFVMAGIHAMNSVPPASEIYLDIQTVPAHWWYGILLQASIHALRRLVFGLSFQERAIIFGEPGSQGVSSAGDRWTNLYQQYSELWLTVSTNVKTKKLPQIGQIVIPEYTLPGGRARWYRYMYTTGMH